MLDQGQRTAILELRKNGQGIRAIAKALGVSRKAVRDVLRSNTAEVPRIERRELAEPHREDILELYRLCKGNLVRVHEELVENKKVDVSYQALTAFCRRHGIGREPKEPAGQYHFEPGEEMQHDTSPHTVELAGQWVKAQIVSLVLCYSRLLFFQIFPAFDRFVCKLFLTDALRYMGGAARKCMVDNTHVIVLRGSGATMEVGPEMAAFSERLGFTFVAHEIGDANRSARVERPFDHIQRNFLAHRPATDWADLNRQALVWCDKVNARPKKGQRVSPRELHALEGTRLEPLPAYLPDVYRLHHRIVDVEGYVSVHAHRYSAPYTLIGRQIEVRELRDTIELYDGPRRMAVHRRVLGQAPVRVTDKEHRPPRGQSPVKADPPEQQELQQVAPLVAAYLSALREKTPGRGTVAARRLLRMWRDYPHGPLLAAVKTAAEYRLFDLDRLERMVLARIASDFFPSAGDGESPNE